MELEQVQILKSISSFLEKFNIPYMLTGALSVVYYGRPRASHDIDFVVEIHPKYKRKILLGLKTLSSEFMRQESAVEEAIRRKSMFNILHLPTMLKIDFWLLKDDEFDQSRFKRRQRVELFDQPMVIATAEDTILKKLLWYQEAGREKHLIDAAFVYQIQEKELNKIYLNTWARKIRVSSLLKKLPKINLEEYI